MFGFSLLLVAGTAFLVVVTAAVVMVFTRGKGGEGMGCCAGCGLAFLLFAGVAFGAVLLIARAEHREARIRIEHDHDAHRSSPPHREHGREWTRRRLEQEERRLERRIEKLERAAERIERRLKEHGEKH